MYFLKEALNSQKKYRNEKELDSIEFLDEIKSKLKHVANPKIPLFDLPKRDLSLQVLLYQKYILKPTKRTWAHFTLGVL